MKTVRKRRFAGLGPLPLVVLLLAAAAPPRAAGPVVTTDLGAVRGVAIGRGAAFRGIPFAAPPVGALRWREAAPARPWRGIRAATAFGPLCIQPTDARTAGLPQSEDCLTLNVVTPDRAAHGLPVLISVHGGAFFVGSGRYIADHDLSPIVRRGVVLVSPNYRLGRLGFFAHPALTAEAGHGTGNFWLSDQIAALRWVKRNIARFGGDPGAVTILGCSAGGSSINALMASPAARGLFARAATHSGGGFFNATRPLAVAEAEGMAFAARAGIAPGAPDIPARLRALSPAQILAADPGPPNFGAIVDGRLLPGQISAIFARGAQAPVPFISGSTSNEASVFGLMGFDAAVLRDRFGIDMAAIRPVYEADGPLSDAEFLRRVQTDFIFTSAGLGMADLAAGAAPAWSYHFAYVPAAERATAPGAPHCADMPYIAGLPAGAAPADQALARTLQSYWYHFIARGDPNGPGLPAWPPTESGRSRPLVIGDDIRPQPGFQAARRALWLAKWRADIGAAPRPTP